MQDTEVKIECMCNNEVVKFKKFINEADIYAMVYRYQTNGLSLWDRVKVLFGKQILDEIIISKEDTLRLVEFFKETLNN